MTLHPSLLAGTSEHPLLPQPYSQVHFPTRSFHICTTSHVHVLSPTLLCPSRPGPALHPPPHAAYSGCTNMLSHCGGGVRGMEGPEAFSLEAGILKVRKKRGTFNIAQTPPPTQPHSENSDTQCHVGHDVTHTHTRALVAQIHREAPRIPSHTVAIGQRHAQIHRGTPSITH